MSFERKKVATETLSEYLQSVRSALGLSIKEVSEKTGIKTGLLQNMESGDFLRLPADVYIFGFLRQLANLYTVEADELILQYKKEKGIQRQLAAKSSFLKSAWKEEFFKKLVITPKFLTIFLGVIFIALTLGYIIWQVWSINKTPSLQILNPQNNAFIAAASVEILGTTDPSASLTINDQNIFVDSQGKFQSRVGLTPGPKEIIVTAKNRFGKAVSKTLTISAVNSSVSSESKLELKIDFAAAATLAVSIDGQTRQELDFNKGDSKLFTATHKILLSTTDAGATSITLNGQQLGAMGRSGEQINDVPFMAQTEPK